MTKVRAKELKIDQDLDFQGNKLTQLGNPVNPGDGVNLQTLQNFIAGKNLLEPVVAVYNHSGSGAPWTIDAPNNELINVTSPLVVDGFTITDGQDIAIFGNGSTTSEHGVWVLDRAANKLTRRSDLADGETVTPGTIINVTSGTNYKDYLLEVNADGDPTSDITIGVGNLNFTANFVGSIIFANDNTLQNLNPVNAVPTGTGDTGLVLGNETKNEDPVAVFFNGRLLTIGSAATGFAFYFKDAANTTVIPPYNLPVGAHLWFNATAAGFSLETDDTIHIRALIEK